MTKKLSIVALLKQSQKKVFFSGLIALGFFLLCTFVVTIVLFFFLPTLQILEQSTDVIMNNSQALVDAANSGAGYPLTSQLSLEEQEKQLFFILTICVAIAVMFAYVSDSLVLAFQFTKKMAGRVFLRNLLVKVCEFIAIIGLLWLTVRLEFLFPLFYLIDWLPGFILLLLWILMLFLGIFAKRFVVGKKLLLSKKIFWLSLLVFALISLVVYALLSWVLFLSWGLLLIIALMYVFFCVYYFFTAFLLDYN